MKHLSYCIVIVFFLTSCSTTKKSQDWQYTSSNYASLEKGKYKFSQDYCRVRGEERECFSEKCEGNSCTKEGNEEIKRVYLSFNPPADLEKKVAEEQAKDKTACDAGDVAACIAVYQTFESERKDNIILRRAPNGFLKKSICKKSGIICRYTNIKSVYPIPSKFDVSLLSESQDISLLKEEDGSKLNGSIIDLVIHQMKTDPRFF